VCIGAIVVVGSLVVRVLGKIYFPVFETPRDTSHSLHTSQANQ
jgi:hypothetical protein